MQFIFLFFLQFKNATENCMRCFRWAEFRVVFRMLSNVHDGFFARMVNGFWYLKKCCEGLYGTYLFYTYLYLWYLSMVLIYSESRNLLVSVKIVDQVIVKNFHIFHCAFRIYYHESAFSRPRTKYENCCQTSTMELFREKC